MPGDLVPNSTQVRITPPGSSYPIWLGTVAPVSKTKYSYVFPGGSKQASCLLAAPASYRHQVLSVGGYVELFRGGHRLWDGTLDEPQPGADGWSISATGTGVQGSDWLAVYTDAWPTSEPDEVVNNAISRGLPWVNPGIGAPSGIWLGQAQDSGQQYVADILNLACTRGGLGWYASAQPGGQLGTDLVVAPLPSVASRVLIVNSPVPRAYGGDVRAIFVRYESATDSLDASTTATYSLTSVTNTGHGGREYFLDLSNAGVMTTAAAQAVASQVLKIYQRSSFAGPFPVTGGNLLTTGGVPVDPGCEQAGLVVRPILADYAYGGEVSPLVPTQFIAAEYEWDDDALAGQVTPYQTLTTSLSGMLSETATVMTPITAGT